MLAERRVAAEALGCVRVCVQEAKRQYVSVRESEC